MKERCRFRQVFLAAGAFVLLVLASCSKNVFNVDTYKEIIDKSSPVDSVDARHNWLLVEDHAYVVKADAGVGARKAMILNDNPLSQLSAEVMAEANVEDGGEVRLNVTVPTHLSELYAALVDADGRYTVASIDYMLKNHGCNGMLDGGTLIGDDRMIDTQLIEEYITQRLNGVISEDYRKVKR